VRTVYKEEEVWKTRPETVTKTVTETKYREEQIELTRPVEVTITHDRTRTVTEYKLVEETLYLEVPVQESREITYVDEDGVEHTKTEYWTTTETKPFTNKKYKPHDVIEHYTEEETIIEIETYFETIEVPYTEEV